MWALSLFPSVYARARARKCARVWVRGGRFYFTRIIIPLEDRAPIPPLAEPSRAMPRRISRARAYLWMDSLLTFGRVSLSRFGSLVVLTALPPLRSVLTRRRRVLYAMFDRLKRHEGEQGLVYLVF